MSKLKPDPQPRVERGLSYALPDDSEPPVPDKDGRFTVNLTEGGEHAFTLKVQSGDYYRTIALMHELWLGEKGSEQMTRGDMRALVRMASKHPPEDWESIRLNDMPIDPALRRAIDLEDRGEKWPAKSLLDLCHGDKVYSRRVRSAEGVTRAAMLGMAQALQNRDVPEYYWREWTPEFYEVDEDRQMPQRLND